MRDATPADAEACARTYRPYVLETTITVELEPPVLGDHTASPAEPV